MIVNIEVPEDLSARLIEDGESLERQVLEALAAEGYRAGKLTTAEVQRMLGLSSRLQTDAFLKGHEAYMDYTEEEIREEVEAIHKVLGG